MVSALMAGTVALAAVACSSDDNNGATPDGSSVHVDGGATDASALDAPGGGGTDAGPGTAGDGPAGSTDIPVANATYTIAPAAPTISIPQGGNSAVTVTIDRQGFVGTVSFAATGAPAGVTLAFTPMDVTGATTSLGFTLTSAVVAGTYPITITGTSGTMLAVTQVSLIVVAPKTVLLVDNDGSDNNSDPNNPTPDASQSDTLFAHALTTLGLSYDTWVVTDQHRPTNDDMKKYTTVVWYSGDQYSGPNTTISQNDEIQLEAWLNQAGKRLVIFSNEFVYSIDQSVPANVDTSWAGITDTLFNQYIGGKGGQEVDSSITNHVTTVSGVASTVTAGLSLIVAAGGDDAHINSYYNLVNPAAGTDTLLTIQAVTEDTGDAHTVAVATGRKNVGTAATSKVVYVGFSVENITDVNAADMTQAKTLAALFAY